MKQSHQTTLRAAVTLEGIGVHSGDEARVVLHPAEANHGIAFLRTGLPGGRERLIDARHLTVTATELCTVIGDRDSGAVATVEHLMSALYGLGVDNVLVEIDGPEMPILDGSAAAFRRGDRGGRPRRRGRVRASTSRSSRRSASPRAAPSPSFARTARGFRVDVEIDFDNPAIGRQRRAVELTPAAYRREVCRARTFGFMRDVEKLWKAGFALGASLENTVAIGDDAVINPEGLRYADEFVRHKLLDAVGDLALSGYPILGYLPLLSAAATA